MNEEKEKVEEGLKIEGRNAVIEAFRSGKTIDKLFVLDGCQDGPIRTIVREARKYDTIINFVEICNKLLHLIKVCSIMDI